jgi:hypothetical protein
MRPLAGASRTAPSSGRQLTQWTSNKSFGSRSLAHWLSRQYSLPCAGDGGAGRKRRLSNASCSGGRGFETENDKGAGVGRASSGPRRRAKGVLEPLQLKRMPPAEPPPRDSRFGSPLKLANVHWVKPELVVEVTYLTWTEDNLLRQVSYQAQRENKPASHVARPIPHLPKR